MAVRLIDIAEKSGVSFGAVSQVLRNPDHPRFSRATRERVLSIASQMGYRPNRIASGLRTGRTGVIALIVPWNAPEILDTAQHHASAEGLRLMIQLTPTPDLELERRSLQAAIDWRVDGLIWMPFGMKSNYADLMRQIRQASIQVSLYGRSVAQLPDAYSVLPDYGKGIRSTVDHLVEQGYREVAYLMTSPGDFVDRRYRRSAFKSRMTEKGVPYRTIREKSAFHLPQLREYLKAKKEPVAVLCDGDLGTVRVIEIAEEMNIDIPSQLGVVGIGDMVLGNARHLGELMRPKITMLYRPAAHMTELAIRTLLGRIRAQETDEPFVDERFDHRYRHVVPMQLIHRDSTRRLS